MVARERNMLGDRSMMGGVHAQMLGDDESKVD